ncbi:hypothetical protein D3C78_1443890 [compost metagenome]
MPSLWIARSAGSSGKVVVTAPFSVMPQAETICVFTTDPARSTSALGIGAPAARKVRSEVSASGCCGAISIRSARKGVEAMVKVGRSALATRTAKHGSQTSCSTARHCR